jgi:hypothetical protein
MGFVRGLSLFEAPFDKVNATVYFGNEPIALHARSTPVRYTMRQRGARRLRMTLFYSCQMDRRSKWRLRLSGHMRGQQELD